MCALVCMHVCVCDFILETILINRIHDSLKGLYFGAVNESLFLQ